MIETELLNSSCDGILRVGKTQGGTLVGDTLNDAVVVGLTVVGTLEVNGTAVTDVVEVGNGVVGVPVISRAEEDVTVEVNRGHITENTFASNYNYLVKHE